MSQTRGSIVEVSSLDAFEKMTAHPGSVSGWFDPLTSYGEVKFNLQRDAQSARREV